MSFSSFASDAAAIASLLADFHARTSRGEGPAIHQRPLVELIDELDLESLVRDGGLAGERLAGWMQRYLDNLTPIYHPANIAHQQAVPHPAAALAGLVDNFVSSDGSIYELGPASVALEFFLVNWLLEKVGWQPAPEGGGVLLDGGSLANLTALLAARTRVAPQVFAEGNPADLALLAPAGAHYSVARAAGIMGLGRRAVYPLETDERGLIRPERLAAAYERVLMDGKRPFALVANAGTTVAGLYDPLAEVGAFCRERELWLHVDAAHGGPALLTGRYRHLMCGVELADSVCMNMHKLMRVPALCTALLVRDAGTLDRALSQDAPYLFFDKEQPGVDFVHRTIECTKPVMGLKFFLVMAALGEAGMAAGIERQFDLTREVYEYLSGLPDFECPLAPECNILCFGVRGLDAEHLALRDRLLARGNYYVSSAEWQGRRYLRLTLTNPATTLGVIQAMVSEIRALLEAEGWRRASVEAS